MRKFLSLLVAALVVLAVPSLAVAQDGSPTPSADAAPVAENDPVEPEATATAGEPSPDEPTIAPAPAVAPGPYGAAYPVIVEANFSRPHHDKGRSNWDFTLLNDLERLIRGSYMTPQGTIKPAAQRKATRVYVSVSRMENSERVGREMIRAAQHGVTVRFIHGKATQSGSSRYLMKKLNAEKTGSAKLCHKGKSLACLSTLKGAIMHTKLVMVSSTYSKDGEPALGAVWTGSTNYGGRSAERTYNNGMTVYNDKKLWVQMSALWNDMWAERNINNDYLSYVKARSSSYGYSTAVADGYTSAKATYGMFYSNQANVTIYATPIKATPTNGRDPIMNMLDRIVPDGQCRIRLLENRFKYRRIAVAHKLTELSRGGCRISAVAFFDPKNSSTYKLHCQLAIRICRPILDELKTAAISIDTAYAHPHDKTILVEAKLKPNKLNPEERTPEGAVWPAAGHRTQLVLSGSAALTGSNLVMSDEVTTETTDADVFDQYLEHWKAITTTKSYKVFKY